MNTVVLFIVWASVFVDALKFSLKDIGKPSHWNNKLTDIVDICGLIEQQTESPQKLSLQWILMKPHYMYKLTKHFQIYLQQQI